jgi:hypothetical protein
MEATEEIFHEQERRKLNKSGEPPGKKQQGNTQQSTGVRRTYFVTSR